MTEALDVFALPLDALAAVEASAGTGKTTTITRLYLRLILERGLDVAKILVITYTRAATEELRGRIRGLLAEARDVFAGKSLDGASDSRFWEQVLERFPDRVAAARAVEDALRTFDTAAVFTIHGFCQRALADAAFEGGLPFETELVAEQGDFLQEVADDFWRMHLYEASPLFVAYVLAKKLAPERLARLVGRTAGRPHVAIVAAGVPGGTGAVETRYATAWAAVRASWQEHGAAVRALLEGATVLNAATYKRAKIASWCDEIDACCAGETPPLDLDEGFTHLARGKLTEKTKRNQTTPTHPVFDACQALVDAHPPLVAAFDQRIAALKVELVDWAGEEMARRKSRRQLQSFDDLLLALARTLDDPGHGEDLARRLRQDYPAALIDEFQDTDAVQWKIFRRLYAGQDLPAFLVGDPKQAIYAFRGADIFTYLAARRDTAAQVPLVVNWRSAPDLVRAVNALFAGPAQPFVFREITFPAAVPAPALRRMPLRVDEDGGAPLRLWLLDDDGEVVDKKVARRRIARATAGEIVRLLGLGAQRRAWVGEAPLCGADIAVLVPRYQEGRLIRAALAERGVPSVQQAVDSVFHAPAAVEVERVLLALADPGNAPLLRAALATRLFGVGGNEILALADDEEGWSRRVERFHQYRRLWRAQGFGRAFRTLLDAEGVAARLLALPEGERLLTDVLHLADLLEEQARTSRLGLDGLAEWLGEKRRGERERDDVLQLRLESDEKLVRIVTVHGSKGLEYPVVFCPFVWDGRIRSAGATEIEFHDPAQDHRAMLDVGSPQRDTAQRLARGEELAERLRLLYVAVTRARERCYVVWGRITDCETSPLAWLLHPPPVAGDDPVEALRAHVKGLPAGALHAAAAGLAERAAGTIRVAALPGGAAAPVRWQPVVAEGVLAAKRFAGRVPEPWRVASYSSLTAGLEVEAPDHDPTDLGAVEPAGPARRDIFGFPRGTRAGSCLHAILERIDFADPDRSAHERAIGPVLAAHGFEQAWTPVVAGLVERVVATPLDDAGTLRLARVDRRRRLDEVEFHHPLGGLTAKALRDVLLAHGFDRPPFGEATRRLAFDRVRGFMKGFIDVVFECDGRYWLADWKSNWLGAEAAAYAADRLPVAMARHAYHLQYLIYTVVVHRLLRQRVPGYDYDAHFGGVRYLFLRGMDPARGPAAGVFGDRPSRALVEALDTLMARGGA